MAILFFLFFAACGQRLSRRPVAAVPLKYRLDAHWPVWTPGFSLGDPAGIGIDTAGNILVFRRADRKWPLIGPMSHEPIGAATILVLDKLDGKILRSWGEQMFVMPHGLTVDAANHIWVTDVGLQQVFKFNMEGQLLMKWGVAGISGKDSAHFNRPTDVAVAPDGSFYVADGYGNSRVVKFSASGQYLLEWGVKGAGEGAFNTPHSLALDERGNVYVADRENRRIQIFDSSGHFLRSWTDPDWGRICAVAYDGLRKRIIAVDDATAWFNLQHKGSDVIVLDSTGSILGRLGRSGHYGGPACWYHDLAVDRDGNIYVADILGDRLQKLVPED